jgi:predicted amidophosphoribosyltransferase
MELARRLLDLLAPPRCAACDAFLQRDAVFCAGCLPGVEPPPPLPSGTTASWAYGGPIASALRTVKYGGRIDRLRALRRLIVTRLPDAAAVDLVAPVPMHRARLVERGFDQAALLAVAVGRALCRPVVGDLIVRVVATERLAGLSAAERKARIDGAFRTDRRAAARVLLIDDVRTTGATLGAAARVIEAAGGLALAHVLSATPRE